MWEVGQKVILSHNYSLDKVVTIERVTPSGMAVIGGDLFKPDGYRRGNGRYDFTRICPATEEEIAEVERKNCIANVRRMAREFNVDGLDDYDTAMKVLEHLKAIKSLMKGE